MLLALPFATRLAAHLSSSRRAGLPFEEAWDAAVLAERPEPDTFPWPMTDTKRLMRQGYHRQQVGPKGGANMPALMERDRLYKHPAAATVAIERRCGWGGARCAEGAREGGWLCEEHGEIIARIPRACIGPKCHRDAMPDTQHCGRHKHLSEAHQRGSDAMRAK